MKAELTPSRSCVTWWAGFKTRERVRPGTFSALSTDAKHVDFGARRRHWGA